MVDDLLFGCRYALSLNGMHVESCLNGPLYGLKQLALRKKRHSSKALSVKCSGETRLSARRRDIDLVAIIPFSCSPSSPMESPLLQVLTFFCLQPFLLSFMFMVAPSVSPLHLHNCACFSTHSSAVCPPLLSTVTSLHMKERRNEWTTRRWQNDGGGKEEIKEPQQV